MKLNFSIGILKQPERVLCAPNVVKMYAIMGKLRLKSALVIKNGKAVGEADPNVAKFKVG